MALPRPLAGSLLAGALAVGVVGCGGGSTPTGASETAGPPASQVAAAPSVGTDASPGTPGCVLTPDDFSTSGVDGAGAPTVTADESGSYCVYAGTSGATGGIELDLFPNPDEATAKDTYATAVGEGPQGTQPAGATFEDSSFAIDGDVAYLVARQGTLVVALAVPNDMNVDVGLVQLAALAFQRAGAQ